MDGRFNEHLADFTTEEIKKYVDDLYDLGTRFFVLLGGEPLLRKDIGEIIRHVASKNVLIEMVTNGALVPEHIEDLKLIDIVCVSIDGNEADNDRIRGKGSWRKAVAAVKLLTANGITTRLHATLTAANLDSIDDMERLAMEYGVQYGYSPPILHEYNVGPDLYPEQEAVRDFCVRLRDRKTIKTGRYCYNSWKILDYVIRWPLKPRDRILDQKDFDKHPGFDFIPCQLGRRYAYLDSGGTMYACIVMGVTKGTDVKKLGVKKAWEGLADIPCHACSWIQYVSISSILTLRPEFILQGALYFLKDTLRSLRR